jgi:hypothetical protein
MPLAVQRTVAEGMDGSVIEGGVRFAVEDAAEKQMRAMCTECAPAQAPVWLSMLGHSRKIMSTVEGCFCRLDSSAVMQCAGVSTGSTAHQGVRGHMETRMAAWLVMQTAAGVRA